MRRKPSVITATYYFPFSDEFTPPVEIITDWLEWAVEDFEMKHADYIVESVRTQLSNAEEWLFKKNMTAVVAHITGRRKQR